MISVAEAAIALIGMLIGGAAVAAGFIAYIQRRERRLDVLEKKLLFVLSRVGNLYAKGGLKERYTDDLLRMLLAVEGAAVSRTPSSLEAIADG